MFDSWPGLPQAQQHDPSPPLINPGENIAETKDGLLYTIELQAREITRAKEIDRANTKLPLDLLKVKGELSLEKAETSRLKEENAGLKGRLAHAQVNQQNGS